MHVYMQLAYNQELKRTKIVSTKLLIVERPLESTKNNLIAIPCDRPAGKLNAKVDEFKIVDGEKEGLWWTI